MNDIDKLQFVLNRLFPSDFNAFDAVKLLEEWEEMYTKRLMEDIKSILNGIDKTETENPNGWWETSKGAEFGAKKLSQIIALFADVK